MNMLNDETVYWKAGFKAGRASKNGDASTVKFQHAWFVKALALENIEGIRIADAAYKRGYSEAARGTPYRISEDFGPRTLRKQP
jgi:hypothetical protein